MGHLEGGDRVAGCRVHDDTTKGCESIEYEIDAAAPGGYVFDGVPSPGSPVADVKSV
jgi:hypothetical protein